MKYFKSLMATLVLSISPSKGLAAEELESYGGLTREMLTQNMPNFPMKPVVYGILRQDQGVTELCLKAHFFLNVEFTEKEQRILRTYTANAPLNVKTLVEKHLDGTADYFPPTKSANKTE